MCILVQIVAISEERTANFFNQSPSWRIRAYKFHWSPGGASPWKSGALYESRGNGGAGAIWQNSFPRACPSQVLWSSILVLRFAQVDFGRSYLCQPTHPTVSVILNAWR